MKRAELIDKLTRLAITVKECLDAEMTIVPTAAIHELLKSAVLELEENAKLLKLLPEKKEAIVIEPKSSIAKRLGIGISREDLLKASVDYEEQLINLQIEAAKLSMGGFPMPITVEEGTAAIHRAQGETYAKKFLEAQTRGYMSGFNTPGTLYVGSDHAESFRHYLMELARNGARMVDRGPQKTEWMGMKVCRNMGRESRVEWQERGQTWWVNAESTGTIHRTEAYPPRELMEQFK